MPRGAFNTTVDVYGAPGGPSPGVLLGTFECRLVLADGIFSDGPGVPSLVGWLTLDEALPHAAWVAGKIEFDRDQADRLAVPSGSSPRWYAFLTDQVDWHSQPVYWRVHLVQLPKIELIGTGGVLLGGTAILTAVHHVTGTGGEVIGGTALTGVKHRWTGSGGVLLGGTGITRRKFSKTGTGGEVIGGTALTGVKHRWTGSGGVLLGGSATRKLTRKITGSGGVLVAGLPTIVGKHKVTGAGGIEVNSLADWEFHPGGGGTIWEDSFTDTNDTLMQDHTGEYTPGGYTPLVGSMKIYDDQCMVDTYDSDESAVRFDPGSTSFDLSVKLYVPTTSVDSGVRWSIVAFRHNGMGEYLAFRVRWAASSNSSDAWQLVSRIAGTVTVLYTGTSGFSAGVEYALQISDTQPHVTIDFNGSTHDEDVYDLFGETGMVLDFQGSYVGASGHYYDNLLITN